MVVKWLMYIYWDLIEQKINHATLAGASMDHTPGADKTASLFINKWKYQYL